MAAGVLLDGVCEKLKQGYIVDLGPLGTLYPAVTGKWEEDPDSLSLSDMTPKVNYKGSDDIVAEISYHGKRYRCRSYNFRVVRAWLDHMCDRFNN